MSEPATSLETLLAAGGEVRLQKRQAQDVLQKLRARGAASETEGRRGSHRRGT